MLETIGNTPLIQLGRLAEGLKPKILAKVESFNPGGSVKDRIGAKMLDGAEKKGLIGKGGMVIEPTSGNTGIGLAIVAALRGYKAIFVMPDKMSMEKEMLLRAYGAKVIRTPSTVSPDDQRSNIKVAERLLGEIPGSFSPNQYYNRNNPLAHYETTGPEIWNGSEGTITHLVAGIGTGGTICGISRYLKERDSSIKVIGVDPEGSIYSGKFYEKEKVAAPYGIEGIGDDFIPGTVDFGLIDKIITVGDREAFLMARRLAREEGILAGGSSGAALSAALEEAKSLGKDDTMVVVLPDTGRNYLSTIFNDEWMEKNGFI